MFSVMKKYLDALWATFCLVSALVLVGAAFAGFGELLYKVFGRFLNIE